MNDSTEMTSVERLLSIASAPLGSGLVDARCVRHLADADTACARQLLNLLSHKNRFFGFEGALLVYPIRAVGKIPGLIHWNVPTGWRGHYSDRVPVDVVFFAADAFSGQFGIGPAGATRLDPESGDLIPHAHSIEEWAQKILGDYDYETGWSLAKEWQLEHGPLPAGSRLLARKPFILGGEYTVENLCAVDAAEAMEKLGNLFRQVRNAPDGTRVTVRGWI